MFNNIRQAIKEGNVVKLESVPRYAYSTFETSYAAECGNLEVLKWLRKKGCEWNERVCAFAARNGDLNMLQWARSQGCPWNLDTCTNAASRGHLEVLQWCLQCNPPAPFGEIVWISAITNGQLDVLKWMLSVEEDYKNHVPSRYSIPWLNNPNGSMVVCGIASCYAARNGQLEILKWLKSKHCPFGKLTTFRAIGGGHLATLKWLRQQQSPWPESAVWVSHDAYPLSTLHWAICHGLSIENRNIVYLLDSYSTLMHYDALCGLCKLNPDWKSHISVNVSKWMDAIDICLKTIDISSDLTSLIQSYI